MSSQISRHACRLTASVCALALALVFVQPGPAGASSGHCAHLRRARCSASRRANHHQARSSRTSRAAKQAPKLVASGYKLSWNAVDGVSSYVLVSKVPGKADRYSVVKSNVLIPAAVPGATVRYAVRSDVSGSAWSAEVTISYPAPSAVAASSEETPMPKQSRSGDGGATPTGGSGAETSSTGASAPTGESESPSTPAPETGSTGAPGPSGGLAEPFVKGVDTNIGGWGSEAMPQIASEMSSLGVNWAREDLSWSSVEPEKGVYHWASFDQVVAEANADDVMILPIVGYAPSWAGPGDAADYAAFVKAAVERYGPGTRANLRWWELWNEPYFAYAWSGKTPEPKAYARDALAAAEAAKGVDSSVKLLIAADYQDSPQIGSTQWETSWIDDMFAAAPTLGQWIDGVSVHPYGDDPALPLTQTGGWQDASGNWSFQRIDTIRAKFLAHGVNIPFWITEAGWSTGQVSESTQARYYADLAPQVAARPWIRALFAYCLREFSASADKESEFGLLKYGTWQPKPAFTKLQEGLKTLS